MPLIVIFMGRVFGGNWQFASLWPDNSLHFNIRICWGVYYNYQMSDLSAKSSPEIKPAEDEQRWVCKNCTFSNVLQIKNCQMCDAVSQVSHKKVHVDKPKPSVPASERLECKECTFLNDKDARECDMCGCLVNSSKPKSGASSTEPSKSSSSSKKVELVRCAGCRFENDPANQRCVGCDKYMKERPAVAASGRAPRKYVGKVRRGGFGGGVFGRPEDLQTCEICHSEVSIHAYPAHLADCKQSMSIMERQGSTMETCHYCDQHIDRSDIADHTSACPKKIEFFENDQVFGRMTPLQRNAIIFMHDNCQKQHYAAKPLLLKKVIKLGYRLKDLEAMHHYLQNYAPIIVHIHVSRYMDFFVKDTHYRNQFETRTSSGSLSHSARTGWENRMFSKRYSSATGFERVKYGTINFTNDPKGVRACAGYGASYFLLKSSVRSRCTFTDMDSSAANSTIGTFKFSYHVLNKLPDAEIKAAIEAAKANQISSALMGTYKEIQVHGPIEFSKDIERVYVNKSQLADPKRTEQVIEFSKKHKVEYEIFQPDKAPAAFGMGLPFGAPGGKVSIDSHKIGPRFIGSSQLPKSAPPPSPSRAGGLSAGLFGGPLPGHLFSYGGEEEYDEEAYDQQYYE